VTGLYELSADDGVIKNLAVVDDEDAAILFVIG